MRKYIVSLEKSYKMDPIFHEIKFVVDNTYCACGNKKFPRIIVITAIFFIFTEKPWSKTAHIHLWTSKLPCITSIIGNCFLYGNCSSKLQCIECVSDCKQIECWVQNVSVLYLLFPLLLRWKKWKYMYINSYSKWKRKNIMKNWVYNDKHHLFAKR